MMSPEPQDPMDQGWERADPQDAITGRRSVLGSLSHQRLCNNQLDSMSNCTPRGALRRERWILIGVLSKWLQERCHLS